MPALLIEVRCGRPAVDVERRVLAALIDEALVHEAHAVVADDRSGVVNPRCECAVRGVWVLEGQERIASPGGWIGQEALMIPHATNAADNLDVTDVMLSPPRELTLLEADPPD